MERIRRAALLLAAAVPLPAQGDLLVHGSEPGAFRTLAAALAAAAPGDRILIGEDLTLSGPVVIDKSVTIQGRGSRRRLSMPGETSMLLSPYLRIEALSPGLPLVLRELELAMFEMSAAVRAIGTIGHVPGEVRLLDVQGSYLMDRNAGGYGGVFAFDLDVSRLWLKDCGIDIEDQFANFGCVDLIGGFGAGCLRVRAETLVLEDCRLHAGSALYLLPHPNGCFGGVGVMAHGGNGGTALAATTRFSLFSRVRLSDGNGGGLQQGNWFGVPLMPGRPGASTMTGSGGVLMAYDTLHETGLVGRIRQQSVPDPRRGAVLQIGEVLAPLALGGDVRPGGELRAEVALFAQAGAVLAMAADWGPSLTPLGPTALPPGLPGQLLAVQPPQLLQWPVPFLPAVIGLPVAGQLFYLEAGKWRASNPSGTWVGR